MNTNPQGNGQARVLAVDDEPAILFMLQRLLQPAGYQVQTAQSAREGLNAFREGKWDLVTIDRTMPEMNGEEVAREMRQLAPKVPIILITGFPDAVVRRDLFDAVLGKPFRQGELLECLAQTLAKHSGVVGQLPQSRMAGSFCN